MSRTAPSGGLIALILGLALALTGCMSAGSSHSSSSAATSQAGGSGLTPGQKDPASGLKVVALTALPAQATDTLRLIESKGPFPYSQDGVVYHNNNRVLPKQKDGYYHEYTVKTPGSKTRGARRIIHGRGGEYYWTADHYDSFQRIA